MKCYEYKTATVPNGKIAEELNKFGEDGWFPFTLIASHPHDFENTLVVLMREKAREPFRDE